MTEQFIPAAQVPQVMPAEVQQSQPPQQLSPEIRATIKQAEVVGDPRFITLTQFTALAQQTKKTVPTLQTQQDQENAIVFFDKVKKAIGQAEELRHEIVDFPTKFVNLINAMFKPMRDQLEGVKGHFSLLLSAYDARLRADAAKAAAEAEAAAKEAEKAQAAGEPPQQEQLQLDEQGVGRVQLDPPAPPPAPPTVTKVGEAKVTMREVLEMEIKDPVKLLKAIASDGERNKVYTLELVTFNEPAIKKLCEGRRKIPGVEWKRVKKAV